MDSFFLYWICIIFLRKLFVFVLFMGLLFVLNRNWIKYFYSIMGFVCFVLCIQNLLTQKLILLTGEREKGERKERERRSEIGSGVRPARERPCRRRSSCFFQIKSPGSGLLLVSAGSRLSDLWSATNRFGSGPGVTTRWLCR